MIQDNYKKIYENMKNNSVGSEKRCNNKKIKKRVKLNITLATIVGTIIISGVVGLNAKSKKDFLTYDEYKQTEDYKEYQKKYGTYGYSNKEIINYEIARSINLLEENNMTDYEQKAYGIKQYNYTVEDYKKIDKLDESYLFGFYRATNQSTFSEILITLGYSSLDDFLLKNNYVDENGNPSVNEWMTYELNSTAKIMYESEENKKTK